MERTNPSAAAPSSQRLLSPAQRQLWSKPSSRAQAAPRERAGTKSTKNQFKTQHKPAGCSQLLSTAGQIFVQGGSRVLRMMMMMMKGILLAHSTHRALGWDSSPSIHSPRALSQQGETAKEKHPKFHLQAHEARAGPWLLKSPGSGDQQQSWHHK